MIKNKNNAGDFNSLLQSFTYCENLNNSSVYHKKTKISTNIAKTIPVDILSFLFSVFVLQQELIYSEINSSFTN